MAWQPMLPPDPVVARWWHDAAERDEADPPATPPVLDREEWVVPALAARVRRAIRAIDQALAEPAPCDCVAEGYTSGCRWCRPADNRRHTGTVAGHGVETRQAGENDVVRFELLRRPGGRILSVGGMAITPKSVR